MTVALMQQARTAISSFEFHTRSVEVSPMTQSPLTGGEIECDQMAARPELTGCPWRDVKERLHKVGLRPTRQRMALGRILFAKGDRHADRLALSAPQPYDDVDTSDLIALWRRRDLTKEQVAHGALELSREMSALCQKRT